ncbi:eukaryotic translation initiation factor 2-alpha kinase 3-like [Mizuhopecten yessoensis]|uniref:eukaryotic translation initiation factor 2-alpha kinase 3-like n=1 Tax=Mizuhopecten yessoensis TaxID=6573 RepID=UPI000B45AFF0|nr:eukaryotic translation initiation factor 2-alpha kinase 3-like [Mizuhopecten yessoensis]
MGRRRNKRLTTLLAWFVTSVGALCYTFSCIGATDTDPIIVDGFADNNNAFATNNYQEPVSDSSAQTAACPSKPRKESHLMIVSTLDGQVSAIDISNKGKLVWSITADSSPLLSSSISKLEIQRNGMPTRLIPSLDGGLYQYDGESIEAIPMTVETLLSSSHKLSDKVMMVGSKDIRNYGVNPANGQMNYVCSAEGCQFSAESDVTELDDILVITRNTQTVRAVDSRTGGEKWNFSVGQHELQFLGGKSMPPSKTVEDKVEDDDISILTCGPDDEEDNDFNIQDSLRIVVPEGVIVGMDPSDSDSVEWQHKFTSPVVGAWFLHKKELMPVNVFDKRLVPALGSFQPPGEQLPQEPLLYVGLHHNQLYVQPSSTMRKHVSQAMTKGDVSRVDIPRVTWKPYINSAPSRTPWLNYKGNNDVPLIDHCDQNLPEMADEHEKGLSVWHENYPFDNGYYLYPEYEFVVPNSSCPRSNSTSNKVSSTLIEDVMSASLWSYWRQVISISVVTSILVNIILHKLGRRRNIPLLPQMSDSGDGTAVSIEQDTTALQKKTEDYVSRYRQDFEQIQVLGTGGYGVVFEARNKMDTCSYAVKRIELKSSAKEKVMREVRALAKLEHTGIVRFFHAWEESPPPGWQEDMDHQWEDSECVTMPTPCNSIQTESHALNIPDSPVFNLQNPFGGQSKDFDYNLPRNRAGGGSAEFSVDQSRMTSDSEPSSEPFLNFKDDIDNDDSFDVKFKLEDSEDSGSCSKSLPFTKYHKDYWRSSDNQSFSVQFEDSGCAENEKSSKSDSSGGIVFTGEHSDHNSNNFRLNMPSIGSGRQSPSASTTDIQPSKANNMSEKNSQSKTKQSKAPSQKLYLFIQMQLCQRETLKEWLSDSNKPRNKQDMLNIFGQIVCAIEYVHDCGLMHRDLKPSNIFFSADNIIKIGDFGLVTALSEEEILGAENPGNMTFKHTTEVGTKLYMGPELVCGKSYNKKVDIFSMGMILFELLCPFSTQMERVRTMTAAKIGQLPKEFEMNYPEQSPYIKWLLCEDPGGRPTATEILESPMMASFCHNPPPSRPRPRLRTISNDSSGSAGTMGHVRNLSL